VVAQVSGRPIFALPGALPVYRDLKPGATGPDVTQLRAALRRLGYPDADPAGTYGPATKRAARDFYTDRGFDPPTIEAIDGLGSLSEARAALTQAQRKLTVDRAAVTAAGDAATRAAARQQVVFDQQDVATAAGTLAAVSARTGVQVPMSEVVFVPSLPATVGSLNAAVGAVLTGSSTPLLTIDTGRLAVRATVPSGQQQLVKPGLRVTIDDDVDQRSATGTVTTLGRYRAAGDASGNDPPGGAGQAGTSTGLPSIDADTPGYPMLVTPTGSLPPGWLNADVRLTVIAAATRGPVLVVPAAAVSSSADGTTSVSVLTGDGQQRRVAVGTGAVSHGQVEVSPIGGTLGPGDLVVTGQ
jgi:HlyD family secretion protein